MTAVEGWRDSKRADRAAQNFALLKTWKQQGEALGIPAIIREIWAERQWVDLGYDSYGEACRAILGEDWRIQWPSVEARQETVAELRADGMSTRAIASAVGVPKSTVSDDLAQLSGLGQLPDTVTGLDGKQRPAKAPKSGPVTAKGIAEAAGNRAKVTETTRTTEATKVERIVDMDTGEIVESPQPPQQRGSCEPPKPVRRRPLIEQIRDAAADVAKATARLERLTQDDRFPRNAEQAASFTTGDLTRAAEALARAIGRIHPTQQEG